MALRSALKFVLRWIDRTGEACCVAKSQTATKKTLARDRRRS